MIIYEATKGQFMDEMDEDTLVDNLEKSYIEKVGRRTSKSEKNSWMNSLQHMYKVLNTNDIDENCGVAIEYKIPATSRRIDFMLTGLDDNEKNNAIIFELKQWQEVEAIKDEDGKWNIDLNKNKGQYFFISDIAKKFGGSVERQ